MKKFLTVLLVVITLGVFGQSGTSVKPGVWLITDGTTAKTSTFVDSVVINGDLTVTGITTWVVDMLYNALTGDSITTNFVIGDTITVNKLLWPDANDGAPIGTATVSFSDLFLASGGVINWNNSDVTLTHGSNTLTFAGGNLTDGTGNWTPYARLYGFDTIASTSMITDGTWKTLAGVQTGLVSLTDGTAKWSTNALTGFDTISSTSVLYNGTFKALAGDLSGITSINDGVASWNALHNLTGFNVINADTVTANYFSGTVIGGLYWTDTTTHIATAFDIADMLEWADTTTKIATDFELLSYQSVSDTSVKDATRFWVTSQAYLTAESDPVFAGDSANLVHFTDVGNISLTGNIYADSIHSTDDIIATGKVEGTYKHASLVGEDLMGVLPFYGFKSSNDGSYCYNGTGDGILVGLDTVCIMVWTNLSTEGYNIYIDSNHIAIGSSYATDAANIQIGDATNDDDIITLSADSLDIQSAKITATGDMTLTGKIHASDSVSSPVMWIGDKKLVNFKDTLVGVHGTDSVRLLPPRS